MHRTKAYKLLQRLTLIVALTFTATLLGCLWHAITNGTGWQAILVAAAAAGAWNWWGQVFRMRRPKQQALRDEEGRGR